MLIRRRFTIPFPAEAAEAVEEVTAAEGTAVVAVAIREAAEGTAFRQFQVGKYPSLSFRNFNFPVKFGINIEKTHIL